jgi:hypothetical protein
MHIDSTKNLWQENPDLKELFLDLYEEDVSKDKQISSLLGWTIINWYHPDSKWKNLREKEKYKYLYENQYQYSLDKLDKITNIDAVKKYIDKYKYESDDWNTSAQTAKIAFTDKTEKLLVDWESKLEKRNDFLSEIQYSIETYEMLDKMLSQTKKLWDEYLRVKKEVMTSGEGGSVEGDEEESDSEKMLY